MIYYINDVTIDNEEVLVEYGAAGTATGTYEYGLQRLSVEYVNEAKEYYLYNGTGNVTQTTAENGSMFLRYTYDTFGNVTSINAPMTVDIDDLNRYTYNGEDYDYNIGLQYLRARYYDTSVGSFISQDTYLGQTISPLSQNRYTYCHNSPVMFDDPSGHSVANDEEITDYSTYVENSGATYDIVAPSDVAPAGYVRSDPFLEEIMAEAEKYANFDKCDDFVEKVNSAGLLQPNVYRDWLEMREEHAWNYFHMYVQYDIMLKNPLVDQMEIPIKGVGRADLFSKSLNEVWEVKPASYMTNGDKYVSALAQVRRYADALNAKVGGGEIVGSSFIDPTGKYIVKYENNLNGIITYRFERNYEPEPSYSYAEEWEASRKKIIGTALIVGAGITTLYIIANDLTGVGVLDDVAGLAAACKMFSEGLGLMA